MQSRRDDTNATVQLYIGNCERLNLILSAEQEKEEKAYPLLFSDLLCDINIL